MTSARARIRATTLPVWLIGPRAPSLTFHSGHVIQRFSDAGAAEQALPTTETSIVADTDWLKCLPNSPAGAQRLERIDTMGGMPLAKWHPER
jgi:hypothetical protein